MTDPGIDAYPHSSSLRRVRSTGDVPRRPEPIHRPRVVRYSDSQSDLCDPQHGQGSGSHTSPSHLPESSSSERDPDRRSPPLAAPLSYPQLQTLGGPSRTQRALAEPISPPSTRPPRSLYYRIMTFLGLGRGASRERRSLVGLFVNLTSGSAQIVVITVILGLSGTQFKSPTEPDLTEWVACSRPLGIWACIWVVRAVLACSLNYWGFLRERQTHRRRAQDSSETRSARGNPSLSSGNPSSTPHVMDHDNPIRDNAVSLPYTVLYSRCDVLT